LAEKLTEKEQEGADRAAIFEGRGTGAYLLALLAWKLSAIDSDSLSAYALCMPPFLKLA
jgi:hypothetical protein